MSKPVIMSDRKTNPIEESMMRSVRVLAASNAKYTLAKQSRGYYTSYDAKRKRNSNSRVPAGTYYVYNRWLGMVNISRRRGSMGWWINPGESPSRPRSTSSSRPKLTNSASNNSNDKYTYSSLVTSKGLGAYSGDNQATVYSKNPHYVSTTKDNSTPFYVVNLLTGTTMQFDLEPDGFSESNSTDFPTEEVRGRSTPIVGYSSTGPRTVSISLNLFDDYCYYGLPNSIKFLKALEFPSYNANIVTSPSCYVHYGSMLSTMAIIKSVSVQWESVKGDGYYKQAEISLDIAEIVNIPYSVGEIEKGKDYVK